MALQPKSYEDFSGGFSDEVLGVPSKYGQIVDNFLITESNRLKQRPGSAVLAEGNFLSLVQAAGGTDDIFTQGLDRIFVRAGKKLFYKTSGNWAELQGPSGLAALPIGTLTAQSQLVTAEWNKHIFCTFSDPAAWLSPMKIFTVSGVPTIRNAGLPAVSGSPVVTANLDSLKTSINALKSAINAHYNNAGGGAGVTMHTVAQVNLIGTATTSLASMQSVLTEIIASYQNHAVNDITPGGSASAYHFADSSTTYGLSTYDLSTYAAIADTLQTLSVQYMLHLNDLTIHGGTAKTGAMTVPQDLVPTGSVIYGLGYERTYTTAEGTFTDYGPITLLPAVQTCEPNDGQAGRPYNPIEISGYTFPTGENWTGSPEVRLGYYRTAINGTILYRVDSVNSSPLADTLRDSELIKKAQAYTTGGVLDNDLPPKARCITIVNNIAYYGNLENDPRAVQQSVTNDPDSCPETFRTWIETEVKTLGSARNLPIIVGEKGVWRIDGGYDELGRGSMLPVRISENVGGVSFNGGVTVNDQFFFAGHDGYYVCDAYSVRPISAHIQPTYAKCVSSAAKKARIRCAYDRGENRIIWAVNEGSGDYNDTLHILDLNKPVTERSSFTKMTNGTHFRPTAVGFFGDKLHRGDYQGFIFRHDETLLTDPSINRGTVALTGDVVHVPWKWRSIAEDYGMGAVRKYVSTLNLQFENYGPLSVQPKSLNDRNENNIATLLPIRFRETYQGLITEKRTFPAATDSSKTTGGLRCSYKQVQLEPATVIMAASDDGSTKASFAAGLLVLEPNQYDGVTPSTYQWPSNCEDWYVSFESDDYTTQYLVTDRQDNTTLAIDGDPGAGAMKWQLRGVPKNEICEIVSVTTWFQGTGSPQHLPTGVTGANA